MTRSISRVPALAAAALLLAALSSCQAQPRQAAFEVWAADQNGNVLYILDPEGGVLRTVDGQALGGADRPHMLWGVPGDPYVYSTNTVSNSITVLGRDGTVKAVVGTVGKAPHAAQPNPWHPDRIYVSNIGPQATTADGQPDRGETITEVVRREGDGGPAWEVARFLDLKGDPALADSTRFPSRRPVCAGFTPDGRYMLVTLFDGGLAVVDLEEWRVARAWGNERIARHGCGFAASPDGTEIYVTAGGMESSWLYVFDASGGEPRLVASHDLSADGQDAHGVYVDPARQELWVVHRVSSNATVHPLATIGGEEHEYEVVPFVGKTPDLIAFSPDASRAYVTLRGPKPAPTIPHATVGETPGVAIIDVEARELVRVVPLGDPEAGDFHGIFIPAAHGL